MNRCEEVLMHYGIKGMKWGVRRYQNPDGSLTEAGELRYAGKKGKKQLKKDLKSFALYTRKEANINNRVLEKSERELSKAYAKYNKSLSKNANSKKTRKLDREVKIRKAILEDAKNRSRESMEEAKRATDNLVSKFGAKSIKSIEYDKHGRLKDRSDVRRILDGIGIVSIATSFPILALMKRSDLETNRALSNERYKDAYKYYKQHPSELNKNNKETYKTKPEIEPFNVSYDDEDVQRRVQKEFERILDNESPSKSQQSYTKEDEEIERKVQKELERILGII